MGKSPKNLILLFLVPLENCTFFVFFFILFIIYFILFSQKMYIIEIKIFAMEQ